MDSVAGPAPTTLPRKYRAAPQWLYDSRFGTNAQMLQKRRLITDGCGSFIDTLQAASPVLLPDEPPNALRAGSTGVRRILLGAFSPPRSAA